MKIPRTMNQQYEIIRAEDEEQREVRRKTSVKREETVSTVCSHLVETLNPSPSHREDVNPHILPMKGNAIASGKKMLIEGFNALRKSIHLVKEIQERVSQLNITGQSDDMAWGKEMKAGGFNAMQKVTQLVKELQEMVRTLKLHGDEMAQSKEILERGFKALQRGHLHVKEIEEIIHQLNIQEQRSREALEVLAEDNPDSVNKTQTFSAQQDAEQFIMNMLTMGKEEAVDNKEPMDNKEPVVEAVSAEPVSNTIVVLRLPRSVTRADLYQYFASYGVVRNVDGPMKQRFREMYCFAFVTFQTVDQAAHAFRDLSESHTMNGHRVNVGWAKSTHKEPDENAVTSVDQIMESADNKEPDATPVSAEPEMNSDMILLNQLPTRSLTPSQLMEYFRPYGIVKKLSWKTKTKPNKDNVQHYSRDAYLTFETPAQAADAVRALSESDWKLYGYQVTATFVKKGSDANAVSTKPKRTTVLLVKHLPSHSLTPSELNEYLAPYGIVQKLDWPTTTDGAFLDYAFIKYETAGQAAHAFQTLSKSDLLLCGQQVNIHFVKLCNIPPHLLS